MDDYKFTEGFPFKINLFHRWFSKCPGQLRRIITATIFDYQGKPEQIANRSARNKARATIEKKVGAAAIKGKDVAHKKGLISGGTNAASNLRVESVAKNRGWKKK